MTNLGEYYAPVGLRKWQNIALGVGVAASLIILVAALVSPDLREQALRSWLLGFIFWGGIGIGSLGILLLQYLTGGAWGVVVRRVVEAGSRTIPFVVLLFIPLAIGVTSLYKWTHMATDPIVAGRGWYLTVFGWTIRAVAYFAVFIVMAWYLNKQGEQQDLTTNPEDAAKFLGAATRFSGPAVVFYVLTLTFAVVDWVMTLDPHWFSTMWGLLFVAGWGLSCFSFVVVILAYLSDKAPLNRVLGKRHFHDLGKLMLAFTMIWAYFNFSQYLIIWSGNIPEETPWYLDRMKGLWGYIAVILILFHFAFPFLVLLQQDFKRHAKWLAGLAIFILALRLIDMFFLIGPSPRIHPEAAGFGLSWLDILAPIAVGGLWLWYFFGELLKRPVAPIKDPFFENAIEHGHGH